MSGLNGVLQAAVGGSRRYVVPDNRGQYTRLPGAPPLLSDDTGEPEEAGLDVLLARAKRREDEARDGITLPDLDTPAVFWTPERDGQVVHDTIAGVSIYAQALLHEVTPKTMRKRIAYLRHALMESDATRRGGDGGKGRARYGTSSKEQREDVVARRLRGEKVWEIQRATGLTEGQVRWILGKANVGAPRKPRGTP